MKLKLLILAILPLPLFGQPSFSGGGSGGKAILPDSTVFSSELGDSLGANRTRDDALYLTGGDTTKLRSDINLKADALLSSRITTASDTLDLTDADGIVYMNVADGNNITVRTNANVAFGTGTQITIIQIGAGQTTIVAEAGVTINSYGSILTLAGQYASATLIKRATDTWIAIGKLE